MYTHQVAEAMARYVTDLGVLQSRGGDEMSRVRDELSQDGDELPPSPRCSGPQSTWPPYHPHCEAILSRAVYPSTGAQRMRSTVVNCHAPRKVGAPLPTVPGEPEGLKVAHETIQATHKALTRRYREVANRSRQNQSVRVGSLVWVKREVHDPGVCRKLQPKWNGPYRVVEVLRDGGAYLLENLFTAQTLQRTAEKVKPYQGQEEWLVGPDTSVSDVPEEDEVPPPRLRRPPRRLIEEC